MVEPKVSVSRLGLSLCLNNFSEQVALLLESTRKDTDNDGLFLLPYKTHYSDYCIFSLDTEILSKYIVKY